MRLALSTPVVVQVPGVAAAWESDATIADLVRIAVTADELGFEFLTCSEHVAIPTAGAAARGSVYWDPLATLGFLAAHTSRIRLATAVLVLGYHHPLEIAKRYGTLDRISGGRLILGVGIGSLTDEFELIGAPWARRAARADDAIRALRASLSLPTPEYHGEFYDFGGFTVTPYAQQDRVPIWIGGSSAASLHRAVTLADGWMPFGLDTAVIPELLRNVHRPPGFEVVLGTGRPVDPQNDAAGTARRINELARAGATVVSCAVSADSAEHYCQQLVRLAAIAGTTEGDHR